MSVAIITVAELKDLMAQDSKKLTLLDVRTEAERAERIIPDSIHVPLDQLTTTDLELEKSEPIVTYCGRGVRSQTAATILESQGYTHVKSLEGGIAKYFEE